jgi:hypothetical protein
MLTLVVNGLVFSGLTILLVTLLPVHKQKNPRSSRASQIEVSGQQTRLQKMINLGEAEAKQHECLQ